MTKYIVSLNPRSRSCSTHSLAIHWSTSEEGNGEAAPGNQMSPPDKKAHLAKVQLGIGWCHGKSTCWPRTKITFSCWSDTVSFNCSLLTADPTDHVLQVRSGSNVDALVGVVGLCAGVSQTARRRSFEIATRHFSTCLHFHRPGSQQECGSNGEYVARQSHDLFIRYVIRTSL